MAPVVERNIRNLIGRQQRDEAAREFGERVADARFAGSMHFVYLHLAAVTAWVAVNLGWVSGPNHRIHGDYLRDWKPPEDACITQGPLSGSIYSMSNILTQASLGSPA